MRKSFGILFRKGIFIAGFFLSTLVQAQEVISFPVPPEPLLDVYMAPTGQVFVPLDLPVFFHVSTSSSGNKSTSVGRPKEADEPTSLKLKEGKNLVRNKTVTAPDFPVYADGTPPVTKPTFPETPQYQSKKEGSYLFIGQNAKFEFDSKDALSGVRDTQISVDGKALISSDYLTFDFLKDRKYQIFYYSIDNVGNQEKALPFTFEVDVTNPHTELTFEGSNYNFIATSETQIVLSAEDNGAGVDKIIYKIDGGKEQSVNKKVKKIKVGSLKTGKHTLEYSAVDYVKNQEKWHKVEFRHDSAPPDVELLVKGGEFRQDDVVYVSNAAILRIESTDDQAGVDTTFLRIDDNPDIPYTQPFSPPQVEGVHWLSTIITDRVSNQRIYKRKLFIDASPPATDFRLDGASYWNGDTAIIRKETKIVFSATDLESSVKTIWYCMDSLPCQIYEKPIQIEKDGNYKIVYYSVDYVDNEEKKHTLSVIVDNQPWAVQQVAKRGKEMTHWFISEERGLIGSADLEFFLRISDSPDDDAISYLLEYPPKERPPKIKKKGDKPAPLKKLQFNKDGMNTLKLTLPGLKKRFKINIDAKSPKTKATFSGANQAVINKVQYYSNGLQLALSSSDPGKGLQSGVERIMYSIDGSGFMAYSEPITLFFNEKEYEVRYYSVDRVGNAEATRTMVFELDQTPPLSNHVVLPPFFGKVLSEKSGIKLESSDGLSGVDKIMYYLDANTPVQYKKPLTGKNLKRYKEGKHTLYYYAIDKVKNQEKVRSLTFYLDHSSPSLGFKIVGDQFKTKKGKVYVSKRTRYRLSAAETRTQLDGIKLWVDGKGPSVYRRPIALPEKEGNHILAYEVLDKVGNTTPRRTKKFTLDLTPPSSRHNYDGVTYMFKKKLFINGKTRILLTYSDSGAGVAKTMFRIGEQKFKRYKKSFNITKSGPYSLEYYTIDKVNNAESPRKAVFFVDNDKPILKIYTKPKAKKSGNDFIIEKGSLVYIHSEDPHSGIHQVSYRINDGKKTLYRRPISSLRFKGKYTIQVQADDWVKNKTQETVNFIVK